MASPSESRLPRWLVIASYPVAGILLTLFFIFLRFPYDLLALRISHTVESQVGVMLRIGELSPHIGLGGPGLAASQVLAGREGSRTLVLQELVMRPAWSLAWFRGQPALHLDVKSEVGDGSGTITLGSTGGWDGTLEHVQLDMLPLEMLEVLDLDGTLDASVDLHRVEAEAGGGLVGAVDFDLRDGTLSSEGLPVALPFERLYGRLDFGGKQYVSVHGVELTGPLLEATIEGEVGKGDSARTQPLSLDVALEVRDPSLAGMLRGVGRRGDDGRSRLKITGTLAKPVVR